MQLKQEQKNRIQLALQSGSFNVEVEFGNLLAQGYSKEEALNHIQAEVNSYKQTLFEEKLKEEDQEGYQKIAWIVVVMAGLVGPIAGITSLIWYAVAIVIAAVAGYFAYKDKPIAGVVGSICLVILLPITYTMYVSGRSSIIKIEMIIPIALAALPSLLIGFIISKVLYSKK